MNHQVFGSRNGNAKLTELDIMRIFELRLCRMKLKDIARKFGISEAQVSRILSGKSRRGVK